MQMGDCSPSPAHLEDLQVIPVSPSGLQAARHMVPKSVRRAPHAVNRGSRQHPDSSPKGGAAVRGSASAPPRTSSPAQQRVAAPPARQGRTQVAPTRGPAGGQGGPPVHTLGQPRRSAPGAPTGAPADRALTLARRARAKYMTLPLAVSLAELRGPLERSYRNTVYCASVLDQREGKLTTKYCGNRWCLVCNRIRIARAISAYLPVLSLWGDKYFVTLTVPNCPGPDLPAVIERMHRELTNAKYRIKRTDHLPFVALRKLEVTYNPQRRDYHPHFHLVVDGEASANAIVRQWLSAYSEASPKAQDVRLCDEGTLKETFKYFTKLVSKGSKVGQSVPIAAPALDVIFRAMRSRRVYQPMGFRVAVENVEQGEGELLVEGSTAAVTRFAEEVMWEWSQELTDWVDYTTGECLTGYQPSERFRDFVDSIADGGSL